MQVVLQRLLAGLVLSWGQIHLASAEAQPELTVLLYEPGNPPYTMLDSRTPEGIFADIFAAMSAHSDLRFKLHSYPVARGLAEFDDGQVDIEPGVNPGWRQHMEVPGVYSIPYARTVEVVVFSPGKRKPVRKPADLFDDVVGIVRGFSYPRFDAAMSTGMITRLDNLSSDLLAEQLLLGRLSQIFIGHNTILHLQKIRPEYRVLEIGDVVDDQPVMMRVHPSKARYLPQINQALQVMIDNGEIEEIYSRYQFHPQAEVKAPR
ncbi:transporter substrate-binding domain-containing protein [Lacimicrobium sp. SS2-24]|uniref:substrate-binding periplasmic protein n=1 Tax=Lacimicrobium sp. SS2-24 TaxID=2005569 RepID=UPI000B4A8034|nr:transporter substrate-binding domain-containing protein [Lacimicrobium sp. SS2-24]